MPITTRVKMLTLYCFILLQHEVGREFDTNFSENYILRLKITNFFNWG